MSQRTTNAARVQAKKRAQSHAANQGSPGAPIEPRVSGGLGAGISDTTQVTRPSFGARLRYRFDLTLSRGSGALIGWLAIVTLAFIVLTSFLLHGALSQTDGAEKNNIVENSWRALMRTLDPGTVTGDQGWWFRAASLFITIVGIFIFSTLIGLIASVIDRAIESLRKGRGVVPEVDHTLILGWSEKLHTIISELEIANENQRSACVVVLAPHDRVWMEDEINARRGPQGGLGKRRGVIGFIARRLGASTAGNTRIVCRTGNPADPSDLTIVAPTVAKSIIVLSDEVSSAPDAIVAKVLLGLMSFDRELTGMHVLAEFTENENAIALREATNGRVRTVVSNDLISRITAQICRQAGLGAVYQELLDFDGDEIYFHADDKLTGAHWSQVLLAYETSSPLGLRRGDGTVMLNPDADTVLAADDQVIAVSEDDDTLVVGTLETYTPFDRDQPAAPPLAPDHLLMIGWNDLAPQMLEHLARAVTPGSTVDVVVDPALVTLHQGELPVSPNMEITLSEADTSRIEPLRAVLDMREYERIVLVGYRELDIAEADARTLLGLVHARRILQPGHRNYGTSIVAELLEPRSVQLGQIANPDDFVVSERLTSLLLAQLSENGELNGVFSELLDGTGVEITMRPASRYVSVGQGTTSWRDIVRAAACAGESAFGVLTPSAIGAAEVVVNPAKSTALTLTDDTQIIVVT